MTSGSHSLDVKPRSVVESSASITEEGRGLLTGPAHPSRQGKMGIGWIPPSLSRLRLRWAAKKKKFGEEKLSLLSRRGRSADGLGGHGNQNKTTAGCRVLSDGAHCLRKCFLLLFVISESLTMFWYCLCKIIG